MLVARSQSGGSIAAAAAAVAVAAWLSAGCVVEGEIDDTAELAVDDGAVVGCVSGGADVYTPYLPGVRNPTGPAGPTLPWGGEDFAGYGPTLPVVVECGNDKRRRSHLDVTAGCLDAVHTGGGAYTRGRIRVTGDGAFRALALGRVASQPADPIKWTDQGVEYRFFHHGATGGGSNPGFKAFARYRSEDDLYVASWRLDGVVQIQKKVCGRYTALAVRTDVAPPSPGVWHRMRFDAVGDQLELSLDDELVLAATSGTFSWGTVGIRVDGVDGAYLDDWRLVE